MPLPFTRRDFLRSALGTAAAAALCSRPLAAQENQAFLLSLSELSLARLLESQQIEHLDFVGVAKSDFGLTAVEYASRFFKAKDEKYLDEMNARAADHGVRQLLIRVENEGLLGDADAGRRAEAIKNHQTWIDAAKLLGCHSIVVTAAGTGTPEEQRARTADGLTALCEYADQHKVNVLINNQAAPAKDPAWLQALLKQVNRPTCGVYISFDGVSPDGPIDKLATLVPKTRGVSATAVAFDQQGNEKHRDYFRVMKVVLEAGYRGYVSIEYRGDQMPEREGIAATKALLERVRSQRA